jgi:hypothetical protein
VKRFQTSQIASDVSKFGRRPEFVLIELLVVAAEIGLPGALAFPALSRRKEACVSLHSRNPILSTRCDD